MPAQSGKLVMLGVKIAPATTYTDVLSARSNDLQFQHQSTDVTTKGDDAWTSKLNTTRTFTTNLEGIFMGTDVDKYLRQKGVDGTPFDGRVKASENDTTEIFTGTFVITSMTVGGQVDGAITYSFAIESVGAVEYTPAP